MGEIPIDTGPLFDRQIIMDRIADNMSGGGEFDGPSLDQSGHKTVNDDGTGSDFAVDAPLFSKDHVLSLDVADDRTVDVDFATAVQIPLYPEITAD